MHLLLKPELQTDYSQMVSLFKKPALSGMRSWHSLHLHSPLSFDNLPGKQDELNFMAVVLTGYWQLYDTLYHRTATDVTSWLGYKMARPAPFRKGFFSRANINTVIFHYNLKNLLFDNFYK